MLGHERVMLHVASDDELLYSVQKQWEIIEAESKAASDLMHLYLTCSAISDADMLSSLLAAHLDNRSYRALLHSVNLDSTCYSVQCSLPDIAAIIKAGKLILEYVF